MRYALIALVAAALVAGSAGCAGYRTEAVHRTDVRTVAVPVFASREFRREIEFELTEALAKAIETRTPYKVVHDRTRADSEVRGEVIDLVETVYSEDLDTDEPVDVQVLVRAWFEWRDLRTGEILARQDNIAERGTYARAVGETLDSATEEAARRLAERIVEAMEEPW